MRGESPFKNIQIDSTDGVVDINKTDVGGIVSAILPYIFGAAGILLLIYLVTAGLNLMLAKGDPKAIQAAQSKITNALIGFIIVFFAFIIVQLIGQILGLEGTLFSQVFGRK